VGNSLAKQPARFTGIALESFLIGEWRMIRPQSTRKAQMKTILMLIVGLMLAGSGSMENHVRNRNAVDRNRYLVEHNAVDTICACP
jgi:hypothetical protein